jgi:hypothetical protein
VWQGIASWYSTVGQSPGFAYQVRADVTPEVAAAAAAARADRSRSGRLQKTLSATVANVQAGKGYNRHGGWTLLVAWETPTDAYRNLTLYDGFAYVQVEGGQQKVVGPLDFAGFQTPSSGPVDAHVATWTYEGDRSITGDYFALGAQGKTCAELARIRPTCRSTTSSTARSPAAAWTWADAPELRQPARLRSRSAVVPEGTIPNGRRGERLPGYQRRHVLLRRDRVRHADPRPEPADRQIGQRHDREPRRSDHLHDDGQQPAATPGRDADRPRHERRGR